MMTPKQLDRATILRRALRNLPIIKKWNGQKDDERSGLDFTVNGDRPFIHSLSLDKVTGRKIIAFAEKTMRAELRALGVKLPRRR